MKEKLRCIANRSRSVAAVAIITCCLGLLTGCELDDTDANIETDTVAQIGSSNEIVKSQEPKLKASSIDHVVKFNDTEVKVKTTYGIDEKRLNNWWFTTSSTVNLELITESIPENVEVRVNNVYSEVSIISDKAYKNGIRQDSLNQSFSSIDSGGISVDSLNSFTLPFQVEGINQNETSFRIINGYGNSTTTRLTEKEVRKDSQGGVLNTVWTILVKDKDSNQSFVKTINDKIGLPCKSGSEQNESDDEEGRSIFDSLFEE